MEKISEAMLCKAWGCRPSQLANELNEDVETHKIIYEEIFKANPFSM